MKIKCYKHIFGIALSLFCTSLSAYYPDPNETIDEAMDKAESREYSLLTWEASFNPRSPIPYPSMYPAPSYHYAPSDIQSDQLIMISFDKELTQRYKSSAPEIFAKELDVYWNVFGSTLGLDKNTFVFKQFNMYQFDGFLSYARFLGGWEEFITALHDKLEHDKDFDIKSRAIPGFDNKSVTGANLTRSLGKLLKGLTSNSVRVKPGISPFHKHINKEKERINKLQEERILQRIFEEERSRKQEYKEFSRLLAARNKAREQWQKEHNCQTVFTASPRHNGLEELVKSYEALLNKNA